MIFEHHCEDVDRFYYFLLVSWILQVVRPNLYPIVLIDEVVCRGSSWILPAPGNRLHLAVFLKLLCDELLSKGVVLQKSLCIRMFYREDVFHEHVTFWRYNNHFQCTILFVLIFRDLIEVMNFVQ